MKAYVYNKSKPDFWVLLEMKDTLSVTIMTGQKPEENDRSVSFVELGEGMKIEAPVAAGSRELVITLA